MAEASSSAGGVPSCLWRRTKFIVLHRLLGRTTIYRLRDACDRKLVHQSQVEEHEDAFQQWCQKFLG